ncbi:MAG: hypothetical protein GXY08_04665 [Ruminococcus sp.]|nr:hypothetical protein [Ruminococcus sp.]
MDIGMDSYFGNTIAMLCLITDDGGWLVPETTEKLTGDANGDGEFNIADAVLLQKWLLSVPDVHLSNWKAVDFYSDNKLDVFDLCLMKSDLIRKNTFPSKAKPIRSQLS